MRALAQGEFWGEVSSCGSRDMISQLVSSSALHSEGSLGSAVAGRREYPFVPQGMREWWLGGFSVRPRPRSLSQPQRLSLPLRLDTPARQHFAGLWVSLIEHTYIYIYIYITETWCVRRGESERSARGFARCWQLGLLRLAAGPRSGQPLAMQWRSLAGALPCVRRCRASVKIHPGANQGSAHRHSEWVSAPASSRCALSGYRSFAPSRLRSTQRVRDHALHNRRPVGTPPN